MHNVHVRVHGPQMKRKHRGHGGTLKASPLPHFPHFDVVAARADCPQAPAAREGADLRPFALETAHERHVTLDSAMDRGVEILIDVQNSHATLNRFHTPGNMPRK